MLPFQLTEIETLSVHIMIPFKVPNSGTALSLVGLSLQSAPFRTHLSVYLFLPFSCALRRPVYNLHCGE